MSRIEHSGCEHSASIATKTGTRRREKRSTASDEALGNIAKFSEERKYHLWKLQRSAQKLLPRERVACCHRVLNQGKKYVDVHVSEEGQAYYRNLQTCGSVWHCPICNAKISAKRAADVVAAITAHKGQGGRVALMTLTFPHKRTMELEEVLKRQQNAINRFKTSAAYRRLRKTGVIQGSIRALEVTHGDNGWHPHIHELVFMDGSQQAVLDLVFYLVPAWSSAVVKAGFDEIDHHGIDFLDASHAASDYITKWSHEQSAAFEVTGAVAKLSKSKSGRSPMQLLYDYTYSDDKQAGILFQQYAACFKGKKQIIWSPGLKSRFQIGQLTDDEWSMDVMDRRVFQLSVPEWKSILAHNLRYEFLMMVSQSVLVHLEDTELIKSDIRYWLNSIRLLKRTDDDRIDTSRERMAKLLYELELLNPVEW